MVSNAKVEHHEAARLKEEAESEPIQGLEKLETPDPLHILR